MGDARRDLDFEDARGGVDLNKIGGSCALDVGGTGDG